MANPSGSCQNEPSASSSINEDILKQQQREQKQSEVQGESERDTADLTNIMALCPQCSFSSRSPSDVDAHMASVHRDPHVLETEAAPPPSAISNMPAFNLPLPHFSESNPSAPVNGLPPQISSLFSLAQSLASSMPMAFPNMSLPLTNAPNHSNALNISNDTTQPVRITDPPESRQCSSRSLETSNVAGRRDSRRRYKCNRCSSSFPWHGDLTDHMKEVHGVNRSARNSSRNGGGAGTTAENCGESSNSSSRSAGNYKCSTCKYVAKYESELKRHYRLHLGVKPFVCPYCAYKSAWKGDLKRHMESHHRDRYRGEEELARIMAQFRNNAGTSDIETEEHAVNSPVSVPQSSPYSQSTSEPMPSAPSTSFATMPTVVATSTAPTASHPEPHFNNRSFLFPPVSQPSAVDPMTPIFPTPPVSTSSAQAQMTTSTPLPFLPSLEQILPSLSTEGANNFLNEYGLQQMLLSLSAIRQQMRAQLQEQEQQQFQQREEEEDEEEGGEEYEDVEEELQPYPSGDEPLNLICRPGCSKDPVYMSQTMPAFESRPPRAKRRATNLSASFTNSNNREEQWKRHKCSGCGHRSNWKWDINKHIKVAHPERKDVTNITMDLDEARQTLPEYLERVKRRGRNGRTSGIACNEDLNCPCSDGTCSCHQDREGYIRPFMCPICGHRSNWHWDVKKHMNLIHGRVGDVITLSIEEARRTIKEYKARKRQGPNAVVPASSTEEDSSNMPHCCPSVESESNEGASEHSFPTDTNEVTTQTSTFRCSICKMTFQMWRSLDQHLNLHHPNIGNDALGNIVAPRSLSRNSNSDAPDLSQRRNLDPTSPYKSPSWKVDHAVDMDQEQMSLKRPSPDTFPDENEEELTPTTPNTSNRPKLRARRSLAPQVASSSTQTQNPLPLSTLDNLMSQNSANAISSTVFQIAEVLKQVADFLQSLLGEEAQDTADEPATQPQASTDEQTPARPEVDENEPSTSDRSQHLATLLLQPQIVQLTDRILPLIHRVKQKLNVPDSNISDESTQVGQQ